MGETEYQIFIVLSSIALLIFVGGIVTFVIQYNKKKVQDLREKEKVAQAHAREVLHVKLEMQQETMKEISMEIHDNVAQQLGLAYVYSGTLLHKQLPPEIATTLTEISKSIASAQADLRALSRTLKNFDDDADIEKLVKEQCAKITGLGNCNASCTFEGEPVDMSGTIKNFILRIVQEFLQNSVKHSQCKNIVIAFDYADKGLRIELGDDGRGFDMSEAIKRKEGIGLGNMKKRAEMIGAEFNMQSKLLQGTGLTLHIPTEKLLVS